VLPLPDGPFDAIDVHEDEYVLLVGADTPLARTGRAAALDDVRDLPLVRHVGTGAGEDHLRRHGVEPRFVYASQINSTTLGLVAEGAGAAFVPRLVMDPGDARVRSIELDPPLRISRQIAIVRHLHRRNVPGAEELVAVARRAFESV
jgi:DNA-binding transcriptional LysR family regulator